MPAIPASDPNLDRRDEQRVTGQNLAILQRLRKAPATNRELAELALKYTSRISDLKAAGYVIKCTRLDGGLTRYELIEDKP